MDGYDFFTALSGDARFKDIPFILLTAKSTMDDRIAGLKQGAIDYIYKPFVAEEVVSKIDAIIRYQKL